MSDKRDTLLAFVIGGVIGAALGILYAPKSGRETRYNLRRMGEEFADTVSDLGDDVKEVSRKIYKEGCEKVLSGKEKVSEAFEAGKKAFEEYRDDD